MDTLPRADRPAAAAGRPRQPARRAGPAAARGGGPARPVRIGNNVWIGFDSVVLPGVTIGDGSIVGCRSVVADDVPPYTLVAGNPARVIRPHRPSLERPARA